MLHNTSQIQSNPITAPTPLSQNPLLSQYSQMNRSPSTVSATQDQKPACQIYQKFCQIDDIVKPKIKEIITIATKNLVDLGKCLVNIFELLNRPKYNNLEIMRFLSNRLINWNDDLISTSLSQRRSISRMISDLKYIIGSIPEADELFLEADEVSWPIRQEWSNSLCGETADNIRKYFLDIIMVIDPEIQGTIGQINNTDLEVIQRRLREMGRKSMSFLDSNREFLGFGQTDLISGNSISSRSRDLKSKRQGLVSPRLPEMRRSRDDSKLPPSYKPFSRKVEEGGFEVSASAKEIDSDSHKENQRSPANSSPRRNLVPPLIVKTTKDKDLLYHTTPGIGADPESRNSCKPGSIHVARSSSYKRRASQSPGMAISQTSPLKAPTEALTALGGERKSLYPRISGTTGDMSRLIKNDSVESLATNPNQKNTSKGHRQLQSQNRNSPYTRPSQSEGWAPVMSKTPTPISKKIKDSQVTIVQHQAHKVSEFNCKSGSKEELNLNKLKTSNSKSRGQLVVRRSSVEVSRSPLGSSKLLEEGRVVRGSKDRRERLIDIKDVGVGGEAPKVAALRGGVAGVIKQSIIGENSTIGSLLTPSKSRERNLVTTDGRSIQVGRSKDKSGSKIGQITPINQNKASSFEPMGAFPKDDLSMRREISPTSDIVPAPISIEEYEKMINESKKARKNNFSKITQMLSKESLVDPKARTSTVYGCGGLDIDEKYMKTVQKDYSSKTGSRPSMGPNLQEGLKSSTMVVNSHPHKLADKKGISSFRHNLTSPKINIVKSGLTNLPLGTASLRDATGSLRDVAPVNNITKNMIVVGPKIRPTIQIKAELESQMTPSDPQIESNSKYHPNVKQSSIGSKRFSIKERNSLNFSNQTFNVNESIKGSELFSNGQSLTKKNRHAGLNQLVFENYGPGGQGPQAPLKSYLAASKTGNGTPVAIQGGEFTVLATGGTLPTSSERTNFLYPGSSNLTTESADRRFSGMGGSSGLGTPNQGNKIGAGYRHFARHNQVVNQQQLQQQQQAHRLSNTFESGAMSRSGFHSGAGYPNLGGQGAQQIIRSAHERSHQPLGSTSSPMNSYGHQNRGNSQKDCLVVHSSGQPRMVSFGAAGDSEHKKTPQSINLNLPASICESCSNRMSLATHARDSLQKNSISHLFVKSGLERDGSASRAAKLHADDYLHGGLGSHLPNKAHNYQRASESTKISIQNFESFSNRKDSDFTQPSFNSRKIYLPDPNSASSTPMRKKVDFQRGEVSLKTPIDRRKFLLGLSQSKLQEETARTFLGFKNFDHFLKERNSEKLHVKIGEIEKITLSQDGNYLLFGGQGLHVLDMTQTKFRLIRIDKKISKFGICSAF